MAAHGVRARAAIFTPSPICWRHAVIPCSSRNIAFPEAPYPAGAQDIHDAMGWARDHAKDYGVRPDRIALGGASSGGQLASLVAYGDDLFGGRGPMR
jgi:poly(3-hydroxybutyrate) depolymerase